MHAENLHRVWTTLVAMFCAKRVACADAAVLELDYRVLMSGSARWHGTLGVPARRLMWERYAETGSPIVLQDTNFAAFMCLHRLVRQVAAGWQIDCTELQNTIEELSMTAGHRDWHEAANAAGETIKRMLKE